MRYVYKKSLNQLSCHHNLCLSLVKLRPDYVIFPGRTHSTYFFSHKKYLYNIMADPRLMVIRKFLASLKHGFEFHPASLRADGVFFVAIDNCDGTATVRKFIIFTEQEGLYKMKKHLVMYFQHKTEAHRLARDFILENLNTEQFEALLSLGKTGMHILFEMMQVKVSPCIDRTHVTVPGELTLGVRHFITALFRAGFYTFKDLYSDGFEECTVDDAETGCSWIIISLIN